VYLVTPYGLAWQVQSSFDRLILQVWPSALLVFFVLLRSVVDSPSSEVAKSAAKRKSPLRSAKPVSAAKSPAAQRVK